MAVGAPSANPSGGLAFGYTFTLTDNFTAAAEKIALSFQTMEKAAMTSAARVSASISQITGSSKGLSQTTNEVNKLTTAYNRLARAKTAAQTRVPTQATQNRLQAQLQNSNTTLGNSTARAQAATIAQTTMLTNAQNAQATSAIRSQAAQVTAQNRLQNALSRTGQVGRRSGEMIDNTLGSVMRGLGTMFLGASLFKPLLYAIDVNDEFERAQVRLKGLLGSDSAAKSVLKDVKMDAKNDFLLNSKDLLMSNTSLISQGAGSDFARKLSNDISTLTQVGGGTVQGFGNAIKGVSRILGSGKINARQVGRLETGGANIAIAKYSKEFLNKSLFDSSGRVNISADEFYKMISMAAEKYRPIAEEMRNTVTGLKSMVSEGTTYIMAEFGKINAVIYKQLLRGLDAFLTKLMIFSQTPIGNVVVKLVSAALAVAAIATTALGLYQVVKALTAAFEPLLFIFLERLLSVTLSIKCCKAIALLSLRLALVYQW